MRYSDLIEAIGALNLKSLVSEQRLFIGGIAVKIFRASVTLGALATFQLFGSQVLAQTYLPLPKPLKGCITVLQAEKKTLCPYQVTLPDDKFNDAKALYDKPNRTLLDNLSTKVTIIPPGEATWFITNTCKGVFYFSAGELENVSAQVRSYNANVKLQAR